MSIDTELEVLFQNQFKYQIKSSFSHSLLVSLSSNKMLVANGSSYVPLLCYNNIMQICKF